MQKLWEPGNSFVHKTNMHRFMRWLGKETNQNFTSYNSMHKWSITKLSEFWELFLKYSDIKTYSHYEKVLSSPKMPGANWFVGLKLNFTENIFTHNYDGPAIISVFEENTNAKSNKDYKSNYSFYELKEYVEKCASSLICSGVTRGDHIAGYVANVPEAIIASLACSAIGAVWSSASPDFGIDAVVERFEQIKPKIVFASTHYVYNGKIFDNSEKLIGLKSRIDSIELIISIPYPIGTSSNILDKSWSHFLSLSVDGDLKFEKLPFSHPLYIMFSSGTTGAPKCIVHSTGGTLIQHLKEHKLHCDIKFGDRLLYYTTTGWMMWNWQLSALQLGAAIVLYEGSPAFPNLFSLWNTADKYDITHLGTSGRYIESCMKSEIDKKGNTLRKLNKLRSVLYTGSPLSASGFKWIYENIKKDVHLAGISGGTDICSCFVLGNPTLPVIAGRIQCKGLGIDVTAFDDKGLELINKPGELVCRKPIPSMPIGFHNDKDNTKYIDSYFRKYPGIWNHGDYIEFDEEGSSVIFGRSDATLNPGGVRIGVAEIYSALDHLNYITGSVAVGWTPPEQSDEVIILFVALSPSLTLTPDIQAEIKKSIIKNRSPKHLPKYIFQISEIPVTRSGKSVELSLKDLLAGKELKNINAISNPSVLIEVQIIKELLKNK